MKYLLITVVILVAAIYIKILRIILTIIVGIVYMPLNNFRSSVQTWYFKMKKQDKIIFYAFTPIYWLLVAVTFIISIPYEFLIAKDIH
jgi:hypothetical protein